MRSPRGIPFVVLTCIEHSDTHLMLAGYILPAFILQLSENAQQVDDLYIHKQKHILEGFLYLEIGWIVDSVLGMSRMPQVTYRLQSPPPPLNGYVHGAASDADIIFSTKRPFCVSTDESAISLTSNRMFNIHYQVKRFTEMITAAFHLK